MTCTIPVRLARERLDAGNVKIPTMKRLESLVKGTVGKRFRTPTVAGRHEPQPRMPGIPAVGV